MSRSTADTAVRDLDGDRDLDDEIEETAPSRSISVATLRTGVTVLVVAATLVALAVVAVARHRDISSADRVDADGQHAVLAARTEVLALTTVSAASSARDIKRLLAGATPGFRDQFQQQARDFTAALQQAQVTSTGSIASAGLESLHGRSAVVLVAATGTVKNKNTTKAEPRNYRLRVSLQKSGNHWLVSGMDFVA